MSGRWQWDFEGPSPQTPPPAAPAPTPTPAAPVQAPPSEPKRRTNYRRRRGVAAAVVLAVIVLLAAALSGSSSHRMSPAAAARADLAHARHASSRGASEPENDNSSVKSVLAYTPFVREGASNGHDVALTFDDGPGPYTPGVLSVLERLHTHATFFAIGKMERYFSSSTVRALEDGDAIGDHTETHPMLAQLSAHDQYEELFEQIARVELLGGKRPVLFRPPYGSFNAATLRELKRLHLLMVLWSTDTGDYKQPGVSAIVERALLDVHPGAVILMHDGGGVRSQTIAALPAIIEGLRARGLRPVTVPQLLRDDPPPAGQPLPVSLAGD